MGWCGVGFFVCLFQGVFFANGWKLPPESMAVLGTGILWALQDTCSTQLPGSAMTDRMVSSNAYLL